MIQYSQENSTLRGLRYSSMSWLNFWEVDANPVATVFSQVAVIANTDHKLLAVREIIQHHLPIEHMRVLSVLLPFLYRIST